MSTADEIAKLHDLLGKGALTADEFERAKARLLAGQEDSNAVAGAGFNRLRLSNTDRWIAGVCGGVATATGVESYIWRILFVLGLFLGGLTLLLYLLLWIFVPREGSGTG